MLATNSIKLKAYADAGNESNVKKISDWFSSQFFSDWNYSNDSSSSQLELVSTQNNSGTVPYYTSDKLISQWENRVRKLVEHLFSSPQQDAWKKATIYFLNQLETIIFANQLQWLEPHLYMDDNAVVMEWWAINKSLTFFVDEQGQLTYLKAWGSHIWNDMEEKKLALDKQDEQLLELWHWLYT